MYFIGAFIAFFGMLVMSYFKHVPWSVFANPAAMVLNFFAIVGVIVATSGFKTFIMGCNAAASKNYSISDEDRLIAAELFRLLTKTTIFASIVGVFVGFVAALAHGFDDIVGFTQVMSAAFMPIIGSLMLSVMFFEPAVFILKRPRYNASIISECPKHLGDRLLELCSQNGLTAEDILDATSIVLKKE